MSRRAFSIAVILSSLPAWVCTAWGQANVPSFIYYQGQLKQAAGPPVADGSYDVTFTLYDTETGGAVLWQETMSVQITGGLFHARMGASAGNPLTSALFPGNAVRWLGVKVGTHPEMSPRQQIATVPYSFRAETVVPGSIGPSELKSDPGSLAKVTAGAMSVSGSDVTFLGMLIGNGLGLTNLNGSNIATGTVPLARIDAAVATDSELSSHAAATTGVHGVGAGAVVGTTLTQTLTNKTLGTTNSIDGGAIKSGTVAEARIDSAILRDSEGNAAYVNVTGDTMSGSLTLDDITVNGGDVVVNPQTTEVEGGQIELRGCGGNPSYILDVYTPGSGNSNHKFRIHSQGKVLFDIDYDGTNVRNDYGLWIDHDLHVFGKAYHSGGCGDIAENVAVQPDATIPPAGSVVCIDPDHSDRFKLCTTAYDSTVAGIVSTDPNSVIDPSVIGADGKKRMLSQVHSTIPLALVGRVDCLADATTVEIRIGDMLTSSSTPGHAMKAEPELINGKPFLPSGVIIGKALGALPKGQKGTIKVLLSLR